jgi:hypothetical protein
MKRLFILLVVVVLLSSCTDNMMSRNFGGKQTINIPENQKLVNATWKNDDLWVLTKPMSAKDSAEVYYFVEKSSFGVMEGEITLVETKK